MPERKNSISNLLQISLIQNLGSYLGYQLKTNYESSDFNNIIYKMHQKLQGWKLQHLSSASRTQLITATQNQIPNYQMRVFSLPQKIHNHIDKICRDFLWGHSSSIKKIHLINWETIIKTKLGGLGLKKSSTLNATYMTKLKWNMEPENHKPGSPYSNINKRTPPRITKDLPTHIRAHERTTTSLHKTQHS